MNLAPPTSPSTFDSSHHRRRSSAIHHLQIPKPTTDESHASGIEDSPALSPGVAAPGHMSLSRSPSPNREGGWSTPGLSIPHGGSSARKPSPIRGSTNGNPGNVKWTAAQSRSDKSSTFAPITKGISHHFRKVSARLPIFSSRDYSEKEKLGRGRWSAASTSSLKPKDFLAFVGRLVWKLRLFITLTTIFILVIVFLVKRKISISHHAKLELIPGSHDASI